MIPAAFDYQRATSLDEALQALSASNGSAKVIAGGMSLLPLMKLRLAHADTLIDIGRLDGLKHHGPTPDGGYELGALALGVMMFVGSSAMAEAPGPPAGRADCCGACRGAQPRLSRPAGAAGDRRCDRGLHRGIPVAADRCRRRGGAAVRQLGRRARPTAAAP